MKNLYITNDLLRNELKSYYEFLKEKLGYVSTVDDLWNTDIEFIDTDIDGDSEILYDMMNDYINLKPNADFDVSVNTDKGFSNQLKELLIIQLYEYVTYNYDMSLDSERAVYDQLIKKPTSSNALNLYNNNFSTIINLYCSIVLDRYDVQKIIECRKNILRDNRLDVVFSISPSSAFDYRFMLGMKFDNEHISSINLGNKLISLVEGIYKKYGDKKIEIQKYIHIMIVSEPKIASFIEDNVNYIIANTYEHLLQKKKLGTYEKQYVTKLEKGGVNEVLSLLFKLDDSLEYLIQLFYSFNKKDFNEESLYEMRQNTKRKGKIKVIEKINPYFYEEDSYFKNNKNVSQD